MTPLYGSANGAVENAQRNSVELDAGSCLVLGVGLGWTTIARHSHGAKELIARIYPDWFRNAKSAAELFERWSRYTKDRLSASCRRR
jgi:hypothetical protein